MHSVDTPRLPRASKVIYIVTALTALLYLSFVLFPDMAELFNNTVALALRATLAFLTAWLPFSLAEMLIILLLPTLVLLIVIGVRRYSATGHGTLVYLGILFSAVCVLLDLFVWTFAAGYYARPLDEKLELERAKVSVEDLTYTADRLLDEIDLLCDEVLFTADGSSDMQMSYTEMNNKLLSAYDRAAEKYDFLTNFPSRAKPVMLSVPMSYTHITGIYTFFTGEANINVNFPDYCVPYTAAHELAHQRGIAREDEANFVAFLVCMESDDPYIRYSAYLNVYEYVAGALASADIESYRAIRARLPEKVVGEQTAYRIFFERYRENVAADISQATNDAYLKSQGSAAGTRSYDMVVDLTVAYYRK